MSIANRRLHDRALRLAASLLDFGLAQGELEELEGHLDSCPACRRDAVALRADASLFSFPVVPALPSRRVDDAVLAAIAGRRRPFQWSLVLVAASLLLVGALGVATAGAVLLGIWPPRTEVPTLPPVESPVVAPTTAPSPDVATPRPDAGWTAVSGSLPAYSGSVQMAPGPYGGLYVVVNDPEGAIVALLDAGGEPRSGWPTALPGWTCDAPGTVSAWPPGVAPDGSVRLVCYDSGTDGDGATAFAFDAAGQPLVGWPVALPGRASFLPRMVDGSLVVVVGDVRAEAATNPDEGADAYPGTFRLVVVDADGTVRAGAEIEVADAAGVLASIGPDGTAYLVGANEIGALDLGGLLAGWPVRIEGTLSALGFGPDARPFLTSSPDGTSTRLLALDRDGKVVEAGPGYLPIGGVSGYTGAGRFDRPLAPIVAADGTAYVVGRAGDETVVYGIDPSGAVIGGWPYRVAAELPGQGDCPEESTGCGVWRAVPAAGPNGVLYLPLAATAPDAGGGVVAVGPNGKVVPGWPVGLVRAGAEFWSLVAASDETVFALAVEPEGGRRTSATILDIALDSSVRHRTTVMSPRGD